MEAKSRASLREQEIATPQPGASGPAEDVASAAEQTPLSLSPAARQPPPPPLLRRWPLQLQRSHGNAAAGRWVQRYAARRAGAATAAAPGPAAGLAAEGGPLQRSPLSVALKQGGKAAAKKAIKEFIEREIKSRLSAYLSKKFARQFLQDATDIVDLLDSAWWEIGIELIPFVGDAYGAADLAKKLDKVWDRLNLLEKKVQHATAAASKALQKIVLKTGISGKGSDKLTQIVDKVNRQADHLTEDDLAGAVRDIFNDPVTIGSKTFDHHKEVTEALKGLGNQIDNLKTGIAKGDFDGEALQEAQRLLSELSDQKDQIGNVLRRAQAAQ